MKESIQDELLQILGDLEKISDLVTQKELELGLVSEIELSAKEGYYELIIDDKSFFLDALQLQKLSHQISELGTSTLE